MEPHCFKSFSLINKSLNNKAIFFLSSLNVDDAMAEITMDLSRSTDTDIRNKNKYLKEMGPPKKKSNLKVNSTL